MKIWKIRFCPSVPVHEKPIQRTQQCSTAKQRFVNKAVQQPLFCSLDLLFCGVLVAAAVVVSLSSLMSNELIQRWEKTWTTSDNFLKFLSRVNRCNPYSVFRFRLFFIGVAIVVTKPCKGVYENHNSNSGAMSLNKSFNEKYNVYARAL